jgi:hypothetical protein
MITASEAVNVSADAGASVVMTAPPAPPDPGLPPAPADPLDPPALVAPADPLEPAFVAPPEPLEPPALVAPPDPPAGWYLVIGWLPPPLEHAAVASAAQISTVRSIIFGKRADEAFARACRLDRLWCDCDRRRQAARRLEFQGTNAEPRWT